MRARERGFTLVELMVVVAVVIALAAVAVLSLRPTSYGSGPIGYARAIVSEIEDMRTRAVSSRRWQRLTVDAQVVEHSESEQLGMGLPSSWRLVRTLVAPQLTEVCGVEAALRDQPLEMGCQGAGNLPAEIVFAPDGTVRSTTGAYGEPATIYVTTTEAADRSTEEYRITIYRATGLALMFEGF